MSSVFSSAHDHRSLQEGAEFLKNLGGDALKDLVNDGKMMSFRFSYIVPGDIVYIPYGSMVCEKAVGMNNVAMRVPSLIMSEYSEMGMQFMSRLYPTQLGAEWVVDSYQGTSA